MYRVFMDSQNTFHSLINRNINKQAFGGNERAVWLASQRKNINKYRLNRTRYL